MQTPDIGARYNDHSPFADFTASRNGRNRDRGPSRGRAFRTRLDPSTAITQGVIGGRTFGGRVMNWILGGFGDWLAYLRESAGERLSTTARMVRCEERWLSRRAQPDP